MFSIYFITEILGTIGFAASGALLAIKKDFDIFGITTMGIIASVGGGFMRDIILGQTPPVMFSNPTYCLTAAIISLLLCLPLARKWMQNRNVNALTMIVMDSIGLAVFTINGIIYSEQFYPDNKFLLFFTGVITGVGGGIIRDVLACEKPYIFTKHIYACAAGAGAILYLIFSTFIPNNIAGIFGVCSILAIRFLSAYFRLKLPHVKNLD